MNEYYQFVLARAREINTKTVLKRGCVLCNMQWYFYGT